MQTLPSRDKLCIDCNSHKQEIPQQHLCTRKELMDVFGKSKVTGAVLPVFCEFMRGDSITGCGKIGRYWTPREKVDGGSKPDTDIQSTG